MAGLHDPNVLLLLLLSILDGHLIQLNYNI
ncbi:hypothetical protein COLO4_12275 [Corchorus olitorius]|uniref:Uncharacterized protein n=1 Tax=Corchorus olitorius TaxID=93759 RepID=A0A1R3K1F4_9ROSI|nr:hypothetical protein COLO4_12275 [Corchorus olitorius]